MSSVIADRVSETTIVLSTSDAICLGAKAGYQAFSDAFADQAEVHYCITDGLAWEVGRGTFTTSSNSISRDVIEDSSNSGSIVAFAAGVKDIFCTATAAAINSHRELIILYRLGL